MPHPIDLYFNGPLGSGFSYAPSAKFLIQYSTVEGATPWARAMAHIESPMMDVEIQDPCPVLRVLGLRDAELPPKPRRNCLDRTRTALFLCLFKLQFHQIGIGAISLQQIDVASHLDNFTMLHDPYFVCVLDR